MKLISKQIGKELWKNKIFVILILILMISTSFMYFFVHFSTDGNLAWIEKTKNLSDQEILLKNALDSNVILARNILIAFITLTTFVLILFFSRFFKRNSKHLGLIKTLGYKDRLLSCFFIQIVSLLGVIGALIGLLFGFIASNILIDANKKSYLVDRVIKDISIKSIIIGIFVPIFLYGFIVVIMYGIIRGRETGMLMFHKQEEEVSSHMLKITEQIASIAPKKKRFSFRLSLRKPISILLIFISVMCFTVMFILAYSLNKSSKKVYDSQIIGHDYLYETRSDTILNKELPDNETQKYLSVSGEIENKNREIDWNIVGVEDNLSLFGLLDLDKKHLDFPKLSEVIISAELHELYGLQVGDVMQIDIGDTQFTTKVTGIAFNAANRCIYVSKEELTNLIGLPESSYNGIYSSSKVNIQGNEISREQKIDSLNRGAVSNRISALINQAIGCLIGCIIIFLALLLNFQSSTRDILILNLMGYHKKDIRKMLIDIYRPILCATFILSLWPSIQIVKLVLRFLSMQIGDYMPFQTNIVIIGIIFLLLNMIYSAVQMLFSCGITEVIKKENYADYTET